MKRHEIRFLRIVFFVAVLGASAPVEGFVLLPPVPASNDLSYIKVARITSGHRTWRKSTTQGSQFASLGRHGTSVQHNAEIGEQEQDEVDESYTDQTKTVPKTSIWNQRFHQLSFYKREQGDCRVKLSHSDPALSFWVLRQRRRYQKGKLPQEKVEKLNTLNFEWDHCRQTWEGRYSELKRFSRRYGDTFIPNLEEFSELYRWVIQQRFQMKLYQEGEQSTLNDDRVNALKSIDFCFQNTRGTEAQLWEKRLRALQNYKAMNGNCLVPFFSEDYLNLGRWAKKQCFLNRKGKLSLERRRRLEALDVEWFRSTLSWNERYIQLQHFRNIHGNCLVPNIGSYKSLYSWVQYQRRQCRLHSSGGRSFLTVERLRAVEDLGLELDPEDSPRTRLNQDLLWKARVDQLCKYKQMHGNCLVSRRNNVFPQLGIWVTRQRTLFRLNKLSKDRVGELTELGFDWGRQRETWDTRFEQLSGFYSKHGNFRIPNDEGTRALIEWTRQQRHQYKLFKKGDKCFLNAHQVEALNSLDFFAAEIPKRLSWQERYNELKLYKEKHGDCMVPRPYDPTLAQWVENQRKAYRSRSGPHLKAEQITALEEIDFVWEVKEFEWNRNLQRLQELSRNRPRHGQLKLSSLDPHLQKWVFAKQRQVVRCNNGKSCSIPPEKMAAIEKLRLPFLGGKANSTFSERYEELLQYRLQHNNCDVPQQYKENPSLGLWVKSQRAQYHKMARGKKSNMTPVRVARLEEIGFNWVAPSKFDEREPAMFEELIIKSERRADKEAQSNDLLFHWREKFKKLQRDEKKV
jgi:hypothetical protein